MKTAIVHEWFTTWAGSENVVEQILACFPDSDLFALIEFMADDDRARLRGKTVTTSFLQKLPFARSRYRGFLPLMPLAIRQFDLSGYDLVISSSHAVAKGVRTRPGQIHVSYVHSPMRYAWDLQRQYLGDAGLDKGMKGALAQWMLRRLRTWDSRTAGGVDHFIANSRYVASRIGKAYGRVATVVYPPVDVQAFAMREQKEDFYVAASRFVPYKKLDVVLRAFALMPDKRLVVIGGGPDERRLRAFSPPNATILGRLDRRELIHYLQRARALVFAAEEDFGILPVEAQACGTPVIAYGRGGVTETVLGEESDEPTGLFFHSQTPEAVRSAVVQFEAAHNRYSARSCRGNAERFSIERFRREFGELVREALAGGPRR